MRVVQRTDVGKLRSQNEDASLILEGEHPVYVVADGMGGQQGGDVASAMAVAGVAESLRGLKPSSEALRHCIEEINRAIFLRQMQEVELGGMGTTLTILWEDRESVILGHVGDSRAYLLRDGELSQVSTDHSLVAELMRDGMLTETAAATHPYRHIITRAVGTEDSVDCDIISVDKRPRDRWLLCSDGLTEHLCHTEIARILSDKDLKNAADCLVREALKNGGRDNITVLVLEAE